MISNSIISTEMSAQIAMLAQERDELDNKIEASKQQSVGLIYQMISEIAGANMRLEMQKIQLTSSNSFLEKEIIQLKDKHKKEIGNFFDSAKLEITLVAAKVQLIVEKFISYQRNDDFAISLKNIALLKTLQIDIAKCNDNAISIYPEYEVLGKDHPISNLEQLAIFPVSAALTLTKIEPAYKPFIEDSEQKYGNLKIEVTSLENTCQSLIDKKEMIVEFHAKYFEKTKKESILCKKVLELVNSTYTQIQWNSLLTVKASSPKLSHLDPYTEAVVYGRLQGVGNRKSEKMKERMSLIIANLQFQQNQDGVK